MGVALKFRASARAYEYSPPLTDDERRRFFYWARDRAHESLSLAMQADKIGVQPLFAHEREKALWYLELARDVFPLMRDGDSVNIEQILNGREPEVNNG